MSDSRPFVVEFGSKVFLPSLAAAAAISLLILYFFNAVLRESDAVDDAISEHSARMVLEIAQQRMEATVTDRSRRNGAFERLIAPDAAQWFTENWAASGATSPYDAAFVADQSGKTLHAAFAAQSGSTADATLQSYFGDPAGDLLNKLAVASDDAAVSGFLKDTGGFSVVAASNILPADAKRRPGSPAPLKLILAKRVDAAALETMSRASPFTGLRLQPPGSASADHVEIVNPQGQPLADLLWSRNKTSSWLLNKFGPVLWFVQILFLLVVGFLIYLSWRGFAQAHQSRVEAINASLRDELTGLANRRRLIAALTERLDTTSKSGGELSVIYADLDGFKEVNDTYGHEIGDQLLRAVAAGFAFLAEAADVVARLGGDEFAIVLSGPGARDNARTLASNMIAFLTEPMTFGGRIASVSVSAGIVDFEPGITEIEEVLRRADIAMYAAKANGRHQVQIYDASLDHNRDEARAIARELRQAIDQQKLEVVYQPIVDASSRAIRGAEALVRWPRDSRRSCGPDVFVPVAEKFGLIEELGLFVLNEACRQAATWPDIFISVNVSPIQFMNPNFAEMVVATLQQSGLSPERLEIEVTEGFVIDNADRAMAIIDRLHAMHVKVALDDFGTGYSSIGHLRRFKFDKLKLDRSMVVDVLRLPSALRLVQGTVAMADALGLRVTAEGVDDENQVAVLRLAGCSLFQGYLFSKPVDARRMDGLVEHGLTSVVA